MLTTSGDILGVFAQGTFLLWAWACCNEFICFQYAWTAISCFDGWHLKLVIVNFDVSDFRLVRIFMRHFCDIFTKSKGARPVHIIPWTLGQELLLGSTWLLYKSRFLCWQRRLRRLYLCRWQILWRRLPEWRVILIIVSCSILELISLILLACRFERAFGWLSLRLLLL